MTDMQDTENHLGPEPAQDIQAPNALSTSNTTSVHDKAKAIDGLIASIRAAVGPGASAEVRAVGAAACRAILTSLETQVGQPLAAAAHSTTQPASPLAGVLSQLAAMPREQLIEFLLTRLRAAIPTGPPAPVMAGPRFHLIQIPSVRSRDGKS
jgi:hypothetical protein